MQGSDRDLFLDYRQDPSILLRNQLVARNLKLAYQVLHHFWESQSDCSWEDLRQEGLMGLIKAVEGFDCLQGASFASYATPFIRGHMAHYVRDKMFAVRGSRSIDRMVSKGSIDDIEATAAPFLNAPGADAL